MTSTLTKAGQTTVPAGIRRAADWDVGDTLDWRVEDGKVVVRVMESDVEEDTGPRKLTAEEFDQAVANCKTKMRISWSELRKLTRE